MSTIKVSWVNPTTRVSGAPLASSEIDFTLIEVSTDNAVSFVGLGQFKPDVLFTEVPDAEVGLWVFRASVQDTKGRKGPIKVATVVVPDLSPPGEVISLTIDLS